MHVLLLLFYSCPDNNYYYKQHSMIINGHMHTQLYINFVKIIIGQEVMQARRI